MGSEGRSDKERIFVAGGLERGRKGLREGSQKKNGAELPRVPATRGLEGSEGFRGLEGCSLLPPMDAGQRRRRP